MELTALLTIVGLGVMWLLAGVLDAARKRLGEVLAAWLLPDSQAVTFRAAWFVALSASRIAPAHVVRIVRDTESGLWRLDHRDVGPRLCHEALAELEADLAAKRRVIDMPMRFVLPMICPAVRLRAIDVAVRATYIGARLIDAAAMLAFYLAMAVLALAATPLVWSSIALKLVMAKFNGDDIARREPASPDNGRTTETAASGVTMAEPAPSRPRVKQARHAPEYTTRPSAESRPSSEDTRPSGEHAQAPEKAASETAPAPADPVIVVAVYEGYLDGGGDPHGAVARTLFDATAAVENEASFGGLRRTPYEAAPVVVMTRGRSRRHRSAARRSAH